MKDQTSMGDRSVMAKGDCLELLVSQLSEFVLVTADPDGNFTSWHPGVERTLGYQADEFIGKGTELLFTPEDRAIGAPGEELKEAAEKGRASDTRWLLKKGGERILVEGVTVGLRDRGGRLAGFGKVLRDVTEWKNAETARLEMQRELEKANERLKRMAEELERSNEELEEFARIASHDLSAPITSTRWLVDLLSLRYGSKLDPSGQECLKQISGSLQGMNVLVEGVLGHAQVGRSAIGSSTTTAAETAVSTALDNLRKDIASSQAVVSYADLPELYVELHALTQLFQNLLSNAIKYKRPSVRPSIEVRATPQDSMWLIAVQDNGIGIPPESLERVFQPMQRLHGSEIEGSGIGLATCKKIVTRVGGKIWAESQAGAGSTFFFTLPGPPRPVVGNTAEVERPAAPRSSPE